MVMKTGGLGEVRTPERCRASGRDREAVPRQKFSTENF